MIKITNNETIGDVPNPIIVKDKVPPIIPYIIFHTIDNGVVPAHCNKKNAEIIVPLEKIAINISP